MGDLHQPLHAADDHDLGGNRKTVSAAGIGTANLHLAWEMELVTRLGADPARVAARLIGRITGEQRRRWSRGTPDDWALESFSVAKRHVYGLLPPPGRDHRYELPESYVADATRVTAEQLSKAGVRLAFVLNRALRQ